MTRTLFAIVLVLIATQFSYAAGGGRFLLRRSNLQAAKSNSQAIELTEAQKKQLADKQRLEEEQRKAEQLKQGTANGQLPDIGGFFGDDAGAIKNQPISGTAATQPNSAISTSPPISAATTQAGSGTIAKQPVSGTATTPPRKFLKSRRDGDIRKGPAR